MPVDKEILRQYIDACEIVKETEEEIRKLKKRRKTIVQGTVKGSMHDFPYAAKNFHVQGISYSVIQDPGSVEMEEKLLEEQKAAAEAIKMQVQAWMLTVPMRMQRIIRYKVFEGLTWGQVAARMGRNATADSVRKEFENFMKAA